MLAHVPNSISFERVFQTLNGSTVVQIWDNSKTYYEGISQVSWLLTISILSIFFLIIRAIFSIFISGSNIILAILRFISGVNIPSLPPFLEIWETWDNLSQIGFIICALIILFGIQVLFKYYRSNWDGRRAILRKAASLQHFMTVNILTLFLLSWILFISIIKYNEARTRSNSIVIGRYDAWKSDSEWQHLTSTNYILGKLEQEITEAISSLTIQTGPEQSTTEKTFESASTTNTSDSSSIKTSSATSEKISTSKETSISKKTSTSERITETSTTSEKIHKTSTSSKNASTSTSSPVLDATSATSTSSSTASSKHSTDITTDVLEPTSTSENEDAKKISSAPSSLPKLLWSLLTWLFKISAKIPNSVHRVFSGKVYGDSCPGNAGCVRSVGVNVLGLLALFATTIISHYAIQTIRSLVPGPSNVIASILLYQPGFWSIIFSLGYFLPFPFGWIRDQLALYWNTNRFFVAFLALASFKFFKAFVHIISFYLYSNPAKPPKSPTVTPKDVTVIISTVGNFGDDFSATVRSILVNQPSRLIIATVGPQSSTNANKLISTLPYALIGKTKITVDQTAVQNKRSQFISATMTTTDDIICYADDSVIWPKTFLKSALAPFEDKHVGMVGTVKAVERVRSKGIFTNLLNYIGCIYLERHNFECTAAYNIDGGVFVISGRTGLIRRSILEEFEFRTGFLNERFEFGPLQSALMKPDDDNYMTRYCHKKGWTTVFHNKNDACIGTAIGAAGGSDKARVQKLSGKLLRWARTTWRSNLVTLFHDRVCYQSYPWTTYAMFISSFVNLAIIYDPLMLACLWFSGPTSVSFCGTFVVLFLSKCIKPIRFLLRDPSDFWLIPFGILFGYAHSLIRLYALITITSVDWSGMKLMS